jgi:DNA recombination protein RmuC
MQTMIWFLIGTFAGSLVVWLAGRGRSAGLSQAVKEARERENEAKAQTADSAAELRAALEDKGRYQAEAARLEEVKRTLSDRETAVERLNVRLMDIDREKTQALKDAEAANARADEIVATEREKAEAIVKAKDEQIEKLNLFITQARAVLTTEFKAVSGDVLKDASGQLAQAADELIKKHGEKTTGDIEFRKQQIEKMLQPVEETIKRLDKHVEDGNVARSTAEALLDDQIRRLAGASESLSSALRKPVIRGSWGEMTLENALENAGLRAEIDFVLQHSTDGEDGRKRTDAIVNLPKGRKLIIDSKNLMETYIAYSIAEDPAEKALLQAAHSKSLRSHIKDLSSKEYWRRYDGLDCVILFLPHDGMYHAAMQEEEELMRDACEKRVFVTNPMSLVFLLKAVGYVLDQERANKSAEAIRSLGSDLYAELARFAASIANIGSKLQASVKAYNDAIPGLDRFIVTKARNLKQLGAGKGSEAELPEPVELEPRLFSSRELKTTNLFLQPEEDDTELSLAATVDEAAKEG